MRKTLWFLGAAALTTAVPQAFATAPPVGPLPAGPTTSVRLASGESFTATLPRPSITGGSWRIARSFDSKILRESTERTTAAGGVAVRFRALAPGSTRVVFALTRGETRKAYAARTFAVRVTRRS